MTFLLTATLEASDVHRGDDQMINFASHRNEAFSALRPVSEKATRWAQVGY